MNEIEKNIIKSLDDKQDRRSFCKHLAGYLIGITAMSVIPPGFLKNIEAYDGGKSRYLHEAMYYLPMAGGKTQCLLCPNACILHNDQTGKCLIRKNIKGKLYTTDFGDVVPYPTKALDYSRFPLTAFLLPRLDVRGIYGCSLKCAFCINGENIQTNPESKVRTNYYSPEAVIATIKKMKIPLLTFTFNEPVINYEYTLAVAKLAKKNNIKVLVNTGGFINPDPFAALVKYVDVVFYSFKGFSDTTYKKYTQGDLNTVLTNLRYLKKAQKKIEILYVVIPVISDNPEEIRAMSLWVKENVGEYTPVHFIRYWPSFKLKHLPEASLKSIQHSMDIARRAGLKFVLPYTNFATCNVRELVEHNMLTLSCPYCANITAKISMDKDNNIRIFQNFGKNHSCGKCGKNFLPIFMA